MVQLSLQTQRHSTQQQNERLTAQLTLDPLTGVANRRRFDDYIVAHFEAATGAGEPLSLLFLDTDGFKSFNDRHGHQTGDRVLTALAALLRVLTPGTGMVARYGGEEFALVVPGADAHAAARLAERVRAGVEALVVRSDEGEPLRTTVSIGVATQEHGAFDSVAAFIAAADRSVYAAKRAGRRPAET